MKAKFFCIAFICIFAFVEAKKEVKPMFFPGSEDILKANNATIDGKSLNIDSKSVAMWGKRIKSLYVYKIAEKESAIRVEVKKKPKGERVEVDFSKKPIEVKRYLKQKGKWVERKGNNNALISN
jgi:hypothetical protein